MKQESHKLKYDFPKKHTAKQQTHENKWKDPKKSKKALAD
jgi:hypothetical protein